MLKTIRRLLLLATLVAILKITMLITLRRYLTDYMAESLAKQARLHAPGHKRVILIGGSGVAFSTDSAAISAAVGRPVLNMGLHAGLGLRYMLREAADGIRPGDLAVLIPEYELLGIGGEGYGPTLLLLLQFNPPSSRYFRSGEWWATAQAVAQSDGRTWANAMLVGIRHGSAYQPPAYSTQSFNADGDAVGHLSLSSGRLIKPYPLAPPLPEAKAALARFCSQVRSAGADCVLVFPALAESQFTFNRRQLAENAAAMAAIPGVPVVGEPEDWVYPDSWFFDSFYHAGRAARQARSERLGEMLRAYLQDHASEAARR